MKSKLHRISNVIYAPWRYGQPKVGVEAGAPAIMQIVNHLTSLNRSTPPPNSKIIPVEESHIHDNEKYHQEVFKARQTYYNNTLVVGGDHSVAIGSLMGSLYIVDKMLQQNKYSKSKSKYKKLGCIWIDAHADINTLESSDSGNVHGMPLAFCTGIDKAWKWVNDIGLELGFEDLYYWGIRDLDNFEIDLIDNYGIKVLTDKEECMEVIDEYEYIHTSLDIDGLDPKYTPSTGTRADHGLELKDVLDYLYYLKFTNKCVGFDLVEYNPDIGTDKEKETTEQTVKALLHAIL